MNQKDKIKIIGIIFVASVISVTCLFKIVTTLKNLNGDPKNIAYVGTSKDSLEYSVYIKENPFIESPVLSSSYSYVTALVDHVKLNFQYDYSFDRNVDLTYNYVVKANIVGLSNNSETVVTTNPVWNKEYILVPRSEDKKANGEIKQVQEVDIDLTGYNDLVSSFMTDYGIQLGTTLEVKLMIHFKGTINNKPVENEHFLTASIPLGVKVFDITTSKNFTEEEKVYLNSAPKKEDSYVKIIVSIVVGGSTIFLAIYLIRKIVEQYCSEYILTRNKILKDYDERLVEVMNFVKYETWETVDVTSFEELINLSNEAFEPIFFWERKQNHQREAWFCILREKVLYRYLLKQHSSETNKTTSNPN